MPKPPSSPPGGRIGCAILGAAGVVGQRFAERLAQHPWFEVRALVGRGSAGKTYAAAAQPWLPEAPMPASLASQVVTTLDQMLARDDIAVVFSALPAGVAGDIESRLAGLGYQVFSNARDHRMDPNVPLLVPELNADHLQLVRQQPGPGFIVANGNCTSIVLEFPLGALHRAFGVTSCDVVSLQGLSGAGHPGVSALDIVDNVVPLIGGEEAKVESEPLKTLGRLNGTRVEPATITIRATCTRVAVREGHTEAVHLRLSKRATLEQVRDVLTGLRGPPELAACPTAPRQPIHLAEGADRPQPRRDRDAEGGMAITVGRLRLSEDGRDLRLVVLGHNTIRGAAGQSILNAEYAFAANVLRPTRGAARTPSVRTR